MGKTVLASDLLLATWARTAQQSTLQDILATATRPGILSFALGFPAPELFPTALYAQATAQVLGSDPRALQYGSPSQPLKKHIVQLMARRGVVCDEGQIFLTGGAQQGMALLARLLLEQHGQVALEETIYSGIQQVLAPFEPEILTIPTDAETGMDLDALATLLEGGARPAFIYAIPEGHNPLGVSLSASKRLSLAKMARQYHVPIIEDDAYGFFTYEGEAEPPVRAVEADWVYYLGSFSKILAPALRVGWLVVPRELLPRLSAAKEASDLETASLAQRTIAAYLEMGQLPNHLLDVRQEYRRRRDAMLQALATHFPSEAHWRRPRSGLFIWVELPRTVNATEVLMTAIETEEVAFIPGHAFDVGGSRNATHCMRLNFSHCSIAQIQEGISRLGRVVKHACDRPSSLLK